jgi:hypothetical protein
MPGKVRPGRRVRRLSQALGEGVKELPTIATWLWSKAVGPVDPRSATAPPVSVSGLVDLARNAGTTVLDALPGGDSIELRLTRARAAVEEAQEAEDEAVQQSLEAERQAQEAEQVAERCRDYVRDVEAEQARLVDQRVQEARREADARVEEIRREAQADADRALESARLEAEARADEARRDAEAAHERARASLEEARDKLVAARALSEEAMEVTRAAAEEAHRQALQVAAEAEREARTAEERVAEAQRVRESASDTASAMTRGLNESGGMSGLKSMTKQELLDLASAQGIENRSGMTKSQLVAALNRASRKGSSGTKVGASR